MQVNSSVVSTDIIYNLQLTAYKIARITLAGSGLKSIISEEIKVQVFHTLYELIYLLYHE